MTIERNIGNLTLVEEPLGNVIISYRGARHLAICIQRADVGDVEAALRTHRIAIEVADGKRADSMNYSKVTTPRGEVYHVFAFKSAGGHYSYRALIPLMADQWAKFEKLTTDALGGEAWVPCTDWEVLMPFVYHYAKCQAGVKV